MWPTTTSTSHTGAEFASEFPPGLDSFNYEALVEFTLFGVHFEITKMTILTWIAVLLLSAVFLLAVRSQRLVPSRLQWAGESVYGFFRNDMAKSMMGPEGVKFAPYLATLFLFIVVNNIYAVIPVAQIAPTSAISLPAALAVISLIIFVWVGIQKHGAVRYFRNAVFPPGVPAWVYPLVSPIELVSTFIVRPVTLAVRLFANMFAGHLLLLVFMLGGVTLLNSASLGLQITSFGSFALAIALSLFEFVVQLVQAYVFTILTASYISGALADDH